MGNLKYESDISTKTSPLARAELLDAARQGKLVLTAEDETPLTLSAKYFGNRETWHTREQLNTVFDPQMDRAEQAVVAALRTGRLTEQAPDSAYDILRTPLDDLTRNVDVVVLSGGMAHVPHVAQRLAALFSTGRTAIVFAYPPSNDARLIRSPELAVVVGLAQADDFGRISYVSPRL